MQTRNMHCSLLEINLRISFDVFVSDDSNTDPSSCSSGGLNLRKYQYPHWHFERLFRLNRRLRKTGRPGVI